MYWGSSPLTTIPLLNCESCLIIDILIFINSPKLTEISTASANVDLHATEYTTWWYRGIKQQKVIILLSSLILVKWALLSVFSSQKQQKEFCFNIYSDVSTFEIFKKYLEAENKNHWFCCKMWMFWTITNMWKQRRKPENALEGLPT